MKLYLYQNLLILIVLFVGTSCEELKNLGSISPSEDMPIVTDPDWSEINPRFGFEALKRLAEVSPDTNILISPLSIELALSMTANGAAEATHRGMQKSLSQSGIPQDLVNAHFRDLVDTYEGREKVQLNLANSIWIREGFPVKEPFLESNEQFYQASVRELDFGAADALEEINGWVAEKTQDKIPTILDKIDPEAVMFLINAIYFKGTWHSPFDTFLTRTLPFTLASGQVEDRSFMIQEKNFLYIDDSEFLAVSLPFKDSTLGMSFFLPKESLSLSNWVKNIHVDQWKKWNEELAYHSYESRPPLVRVSVPLFELTYEKTLNELLKGMGMETAFDSRFADFSKMTDIPVYIDEVKHKTYLKVNEFGAEAAAVTSVGIVETSLPIIEKEITLDRPFMVVLHDYEEGNILFAGLVNDPTQD